MTYTPATGRLRADIARQLVGLTSGFASLDDAVAAVAIGQFFDVDGRRYQRVAAAPGYVDHGATLQPATADQVVALGTPVRVDQPQPLSDGQRATARANVALDRVDNTADVDKPINPGQALMNGVAIGQVAQLAIPVVLASLTTHGFAALGDAPQCQWARVAAQPAHPAKLQDALGQWWEMRGDAIDVRNLGAVDDCPDVSTIAGVQQAVIRPLVAAATNNIAAFRNAYIAAKALVIGTVTYGKSAAGTGIYRVAYTQAIPAIGLPDNVTTVCLNPGSRIEADFSLAVEYGGYPITPSFNGLMNCFGAGDPTTFLARWSTTVDQNDFFVITDANFSSANYAKNIGLIGVDIRCHTRPNWRGYLQTSGWVGTHVMMRMVDGLRIIDCHFEGAPNSGIAIFGGRNHFVGRTACVKNGYGAKPNSDQNGLDILGKPVVAHSELDPVNGRVVDSRFEFNRDEGLAFSSIRDLHLKGLTFLGNQDRAMEGFFGPSLWNTQTLGRPFPSKTTIENFYHDGKHAHGKLAQPAAAGATQIVLDDAWYCVAQTQQGSGRWLFIPGAGSQAATWSCSVISDIMTVTAVAAGVITIGMPVPQQGSVIPAGVTVIEQLEGFPGGCGMYRLSKPVVGASAYGTLASTALTDGPFQITAVDYTTQTVTLAAPIANAVAAGAQVYNLSTLSIGDGNGNEAATYIRHGVVKNCYLTLLSAIDLSSANGGVGDVEDVTFDTIIYPAGVSLSAVSVSRATASVRNIKTRHLVTPGNTLGAVVGIGPLADKVTILDIDHDGGFGYVVRLNQGNGSYTSNVVIGGLKSRGNGRAAVRVDGLHNRIEISAECDITYGNHDGQVEAGFVTIGTATSKVNKLIVRHNSYAHTPGRLPPDAPITFPTGMRAGYIGELICEDNDFALGDGFSYARQHGAISSVQARLASDGTVGSPVALVTRDQNNKTMGTRRVIVSALPPAAGTFRRGDELVLDLPSAGAPDRARCVTSGTIGAAAHALNRAQVATDNVINVASNAGWPVGTVLNIGGGTNGGLLTVVQVNDSGVSSSITLNDVLGVALAAGFNVAPQAPALSA